MQAAAAPTASRPTTTASALLHSRAAPLPCLLLPHSFSSSPAALQVRQLPPHLPAPWPPPRCAGCSPLGPRHCSTHGSVWSYRCPPTRLLPPPRSGCRTAAANARYCQAAPQEKPAHRPRCCSLRRPAAERPDGAPPAPCACACLGPSGTPAAPRRHARSVGPPAPPRPAPEPQVLVQPVPDVVAVQQHGVVAARVEQVLQRAGHGGLARRAQACAGAAGGPAVGGGPPPRRGLCCGRSGSLLDAHTRRAGSQGPNRTLPLIQQI